MDRVGLLTLHAEMNEDARVARDAVTLAAERHGSGSDAGFEAAAYQLARFYNIIEQLGLRVAKAFENHLEKDHGWHFGLLRRLSIEVPGIRPALFPPEILPMLHDIRGFRHLVNHAYDLKLDGQRLGAVLGNARQAADMLPGVIARFVAKVNESQGW